MKPYMIRIVGDPNPFICRCGNEIFVKPDKDDPTYYMCRECETSCMGLDYRGSETVLRCECGDVVGHE